MIKGGYKIIDLQDHPFTTGGESATIAGAYEAIEASYRKVLLLSGLVIDGKEYNDVFVTPEVSGTDYVFNVCGGKTITITDADAVTVTATAG